MERVEFEFRPLIALIIARFGSRRAFAKKLGISNGVLSMRLNNRSRWPSEDVIAACNLLGIAPEHIGAYFFTVKVR